MTARLSLSLTACGLAAFAATAVAGPIDWVSRKLGRDPAPPKTGVVKVRDPGPIALLPEQPMRFPIDDASPEAELPRGRSYYRRVELPKPVENAMVDVRVVAQDAPDGRGRTVFKPLFYVLDDEGNVRETVSVDKLALDIRPFQPTELQGCAKVKNLQRFLVATTEKDVGAAFESGARDKVSAPTKGGFYYSTDAVKVKLPYAATGELVLTVSAKPSERTCGEKPKA
ncbi:hypothetical protein [Tahibacter soli]|uniref:DUF3298 domain-containing protein n=1 Tax=Tahibacter soli TaxID=2983605 RepID=A0A9X3YQU6_9GAMM|nr:hypothetical protein [Tahibacter soli]MDC8015308.1 hypothetical protein [Tahibacter soli]